MPVHPPIVRRFVARTEEQVSESRASAERIRAEVQAKREASRPARRAAMLAGPTLRAPDAAVECPCACHPRPADDDLHDGGISCPCQDSDEQRDARHRALFESLATLADDFVEGDNGREERQVRFDAEAVALGVEARVEVAAAPFVIVGRCDGRGFYLRERHGTYRVTIAPDEDPGSDPWTAEPTATSIDVAAGAEDEFDIDGEFSSVVALRIAVTAVRAALARNTCSHRTVGSDPYCPVCGVPLAHADRWRWTRPPEVSPRSGGGP